MLLIDSIAYFIINLYRIYREFDKIFTVVKYYKTTVKQLPPPAASLTAILPPWAFTISWAIDSPSPK